MNDNTKTLIERFQTGTTKSDLIVRLNQAVNYIKTNEPNQANDIIQELIDFTLEFIRTNGLDFKNVIPNSDYNYCNSFKTKIQEYYQTVDERVFEEATKDLYNQSVETIIKCRYYWNKYKLIHQRNYTKLVFMENKLSRSRNNKELTQMVEQINSQLEEMVVNGELSDEKYKEYLTQLEDKIKSVQRMILSGQQDEMQILKTLSNQVKKFNKSSKFEE